jgi:hypothetical protein
MNSLIFIKIDVKSRFGGATQPLGVRCIFEMGFGIYPRITIIEDEEEDEYEVRLRSFASYSSSSSSSLSIAK